MNWQNDIVVVGQAFSPVRAALLPLVSPERAAKQPFPAVTPLTGAAGTLLAGAA